MKRVNGSLEAIHRPFGHRAYRAMLDYIANYPGADRDEGKRRHALADQIEQKIVPKLRGLDTKDEAVEKCLNEVTAIVGRLDDNELLSSFDKARSQALFEWFGVKRS